MRLKAQIGAAVEVGSGLGVAEVGAFDLGGALEEPDLVGGSGRSGAVEEDVVCGDSGGICGEGGGFIGVGTAGDGVDGELGGVPG